MEEQTLSAGGINDQQISEFIKKKIRANTRASIMNLAKRIMDAVLISLGVLGVTAIILGIIFPDQANYLLIQILVWSWGL